MSEDKWEEPSRDEAIRRFREQDAANFFSRFPEVRRNFFADSRNRGEAAVLVPLIYDQDHWRLLLTVRSETLKNQAGQVAFPGGKKDEEDPDLMETALREASEEIGLPPHQVQVVSQLPPVVSIIGHIVSPFVGLIPHHFEPEPDVREVSRTFSIPAKTFLQTEHHSSSWNEYPGIPGRKGSKLYLTQTFNVATGISRFPVFGMTASIAILAAVALYQRTPAFQTTKPLDPTDLARSHRDMFLGT